MKGLSTIHQRKWENVIKWPGAPWLDAEELNGKRAENFVLATVSSVYTHEAG